MKDVMNKEFEYRGYKFNIKVELNYRVERRMNGDKWHLITINCMDCDNYYRKKDVEDSKLELTIRLETELAKAHVDSRLGPEEADPRLLALGFR